MKFAGAGMWQVAIKIAISLAIGFALVACRGKSKEVDVKWEREIIVHSDTAGIAKLLKLPTPIQEGRFTEIPVVSGARDGIGPTDKQLFVVVRIASADWPAWEKALSRADGPGTYYLAEDLAAKLLPEPWVQAIVPDEHGRGLRLEGTAFKPDSIATAWYLGAAAVRWQDHLFMEFSSK